MRLNRTKGRIAWVGTAAAALLLGVSMAARAEVPRPEVLWTPAQVADASDRAYEPTAIWLIDRAKRSVILSMYLIVEVDDDRHPVNFLLNDLLEALHRGVTVEIYLNTKFKESKPSRVLEQPFLSRLKTAGAKVIGVTPNKRLHDKLLIVDERYILEGSTNWSVEALRNNWESNTLIDSPTLARQKLNRVLQRVSSQEEPAKNRPPFPLPKTVALPVSWIRKEGILPRMAVTSDERSLDALLLILRESSGQGSDNFFLNLEELGIDLGFPGSWDDTSIRRQVIKVLRKLKDRYRVINLQVTYAKDAWVKLSFNEEPTVPIPMELLEPTRLTQDPAAVTYLSIFKLLLRQQEGIEISQLSIKELVQRTGLSSKLLRRTLRGFHA